MSLRLFVAAGVLAGMLGCGNDTTSPADQETGAFGASVAAAALTFSQMSGGGSHTCALSTDNAAWCWGYNESGQLGAGTLAESCIGAVGPFPCTTSPARVAGDLRFRQITAGEYHTCAVTTGNRAYCWGSATTVGDGTEAERRTPVAVAGGHLFRQVDAGYHFTCGVSYPDNRLYCWGTNARGQLGDGSLRQRLSPVLVLGGLRFRQVSAGWFHACGVTTTDQVYCWGDNLDGQLGDSTTQRLRTRPVRVAGGHRFRQVDAGGYHTCAVTTNDRAFCWGNGQFGQIGNGQTYLSFWPRAVSGRLSFRRVTAGIFHTCAETTGSRAWCWGANSYGGTGNGGAQFEDFLRPVAVAGGLSVAQMSAGGWHTCAKTATGAGFCWGDDFFGQLGDGSSSFGAMAFTPGPVGPPLQSAATAVTLRAAGTGTARPWEAAALASGRRGIVPEP